MPRPLIGITTNASDSMTLGPSKVRCECALNYSLMVHAAGGVPVLLPPIPELAPMHAQACDGFVFTGGPDIDLRDRGLPLHAQSEPMHPLRQRYEFALLAALDALPQRPVLGVCLGMQMLGVHNAGTLCQHLGDLLPGTAESHRGDNPHRVVPEHPGYPFDPAALVASNHHQGITDPGRLRVLARSPDGVIEALDDPTRPFYLGVQWHPERTSDLRTGQAVFNALIAACRQ